MCNDDDGKINSSDSDDLSTDDAAGSNRNHPALTYQATGKGKIKRGGKKQEQPSWEAGKTVNFVKGTKFTATGRKKFATVRSVHIKVANYSITDENCMDLDSHANTYVMGKECLKVYDWNRPVNVSDWNTKDGERLCQKISGAVE